MHSTVNTLALYMCSIIHTSIHSTVKSDFFLIVATWATTLHAYYNKNELWIKKNYYNIYLLNWSEKTERIEKRNFQIKSRMFGRFMTPANSWMTKKSKRKIAFNGKTYRKLIELLKKRATQIQQSKNKVSHKKSKNKSNKRLTGVFAHRSVDWMWHTMVFVVVATAFFPIYCDVS